MLQHLSMQTRLCLIISSDATSSGLSIASFVTVLGEPTRKVSTSISLMFLFSTRVFHILFENN